MTNKEIDVRNAYHAAIVEIWKKGAALVKTAPEFKTVYSRGAFVQDKLHANALLFVGIGASWDGREPEDNAKTAGGKTKKETCVEVDGIQYETEAGRTEYAYYKPMTNLAKETGFDAWSNIDITLLRETNQKNVLPFFKKHTGFMQEQCSLAAKMIADIKPQIIIVSNAFVRDILKNKIPPITSGFEIVWNEATGTEEIHTPAPLRGTPVFFTSMLSGRRAFDSGSRRRLAWHIKQLTAKRRQS